MASYFSAHYARHVRLFRAVFTRVWAVKRVDDVIVEVDVPSEGNLPALARHKEDDPYVVKTTIPVAHSKGIHSVHVCSLMLLCCTKQCPACTRIFRTRRCATSGKG